MAFTVDQLLLREDKKAQLIKALQNNGEAAPLERCITEAVADVTRLTAGYVIEQSLLDGWTRTIALWKAYTLSGTGVSEAMQTAYDDTMKELRAIAAGDRPNLIRIDATPAPGKGAWGSASKINT